MKKKKAMRIVGKPSGTITTNHYIGESGPHNNRPLYLVVYV